ncbi:MAG: serine/threonine-protein kinase [Planctomycetales bacterium]
MQPERIGPYRILKKLGSGGMGHVYLGEHDQTGALAAVKVLTATLAREGGFVERFNREIDAMRKLDNPHIVKFYDSGVDQENYYYAMEYVPGETLMGLMQREKRLPWPKALEIAIQICQALKGAHDFGIIHRDLKPSNLLVADDGTIKLTDFGVAQVFASQRLTVTGGIIGTAEYMSPEQAEGKRATKQSDLYSLGALLYALITGRTPFQGATAVEVIQKHRYGLFDRPSLIVSDLPQRVEQTICRLLEKDPAKRFPDALVLLRHLQQLQRHRPQAALGAGTIADSWSSDGTAPTIATNAPVEEGDDEPGRPGPATLMQGLMRAEIDQLNRGHWLSTLFNTLFVQIALLLLVVGGGVWWFWPRSLSDEARFERGVALLQNEPGPEWIRARREYFEPLLASNPEDWSPLVEPHLREIELYELTRAAHGKGGLRKARGGQSQSEPQRWLKLALHYRQTGDLSRSERTLLALQRLLEGNEDQQGMHDFATRLLEEVRRDRGELDDLDGMLRAALDRADVLAARRHEAPENLATARGIWSSIVELYGEDEFEGLQTIVDQARAALLQHAVEE